MMDSHIMQCTGGDSFFGENKYIIIGLSGKMYSGKDTVATLIQEICPTMNWKTKSFARLLKEIVALLTSTTIDNNLTTEGKQIIPKGFKDSLGTLQQKVGVALREHVDENVWVNVVLSQIGYSGDKIIITDVRFPNEHEAIKKKGGYIIRLNGDPSGKRSSDKRDHNHISETALDNHEFDFVINNDGSLSELREKVCKILKKVFKKTGRYTNN